MNIKVCGITQIKQLQQLDALDIAFAGLIFVKHSPRYVGDKIKPKELESADFDLKKVGVFADATYDEIMSIIDGYSLDVVQLHGNESAALCRKLSDEVEVIKTIHIPEQQDESIDFLLSDYDDVCDYYLFDTATKDGKTGGTGKQFNWLAISKSKIEKPFFLGGGIGVDDIAKLKAFRHPDFYGVDVNSKLEKEPGIKDMSLLLQFKQGLR